MEVVDTNNLDIGDYMDIVTTYKCRFCSFTSSAPQGISNHVKQIHIQQQPIAKSETIQINDKTVPIDSTLTVDMETGCVQIQPLISNNEDDGNVKVVSDQSVVANFDNVLENLNEIASAEDNHNPTTDTTTQSTGAITLVTLDNQQIMNLTQNENIGNSDNSGLQIVSIEEANIDNADAKTVTESDSIENNGDIMSHGSTQTNEINQTEYTLQVQPYQSVSSPKGAPPITKELFLCGQCSIGYNSIDDCKAHMVQDHNIQLEDPIDSNIKVSVGTQVEGKRRGRRRKTDINEAETAENEITIQPLSDSDWEEDKEDYYIGSRSKRKIRRPKALKDDYYLPKIRKSYQYETESELPKRRKTNYETDNGVKVILFPSRPKRQPPVVDASYEEKCLALGCYAKFKTKESLDIHVKCHVENRTFFVCPECFIEFPNWRAMRFHLWRLHKIDTDLLECDVCHEFKTDGFSKLMIHKEIHSDERPYTCDVCGKGFRQYAQMKNHQLIHDSDDNGYKPVGKKRCEICKRLFANHKCLLKHIEGVHSKIKPYACKFCSYASSRKAMLQLHERTHTKEKPFKCDVCSFATGDHNSLRRHTMRHTGQRPYRCNYCPYTCIQAISIKMHMKNKHPNAEGIYCCNECTYRTVNEQFFQNHLEDHKHGLITDKETTSNVVQNTIQIMDNSLQLQNLIELQVGENQSENQTKTSQNLQMQVQTLDTGETQISAEDFARISNYEDPGAANISSGQLITYALNAIAQNSGMDEECSSIQIINDIQISVNSSAPKDGVTNHTVTFHVPVNTQNNFQNEENQIILQQVDEISEMPVQTLSFDDVTTTDESEVNTNSADQAILTSQGGIINLVPTATIDDLAQISCIVKDSIIFENAPNTGTSLLENEIKN